MKLRILAIATATVLLAGAAQAQQQQPRLHFANVTDNELELQVDEGTRIKVGAGNWQIYPLSAGSHQVRVKNAPGGDQAETWVFRNEDLYTFGGRTYWCTALIGGSPGEKPMFIKLDQSQCKRILDAGGPID